MKIYCTLLLLFCSVAGVLQAQNTLLNSLNLVSDASCENLQAQDSNGRHPLDDVWTITSGAVRCFNDGAFGSTSTPSDGDHFFADDSENTVSSIEQVIDLGKDRTGEIFEYAYDYKVFGTTLKPDHTATVQIEFLDVADVVLGTLHSNTNFAGTNSYQTESGVSADAPTGTQKIKWMVTWNDPPSADFSDLIFDNFILRYTDGQCVGIPGFPYFCFSDPLLLDGDTIQMICAAYQNLDSINALLNVSEVDKCDDDGRIKVVRRRGSAARGKDETLTKSTIDCLQEIVFKGDNFTTPACQNQLQLFVEITDGNANAPLDFDVPPPVTVACDYDIDNDPDAILGDVSNVIGNGELIETEVVLTAENCDRGYEIIREWQLIGCCDVVIKSQIITVLPSTCSSVNTLTVNEVFISDGTYSAFTTLTSSGQVDTHSSVNFVAGQSITLQPGFVANNESSFLARIDDCETQLPNDLCDAATPIQCGDLFVRDITNANVPSFLLDDFCNESDPPGEGVFYQFTSEFGETVEFSTNGNLTNFDTRLWLFAGSCGTSNTTCVAFNDDIDFNNNNLKSSITLPTNAGETYLLYVDGFNGATGVVELSMVCTLGNELDDQITTRSSTTAHKKRVTVESALELIEPTLHLFPNPSLIITTIAYELPKAATTQFLLRDVTGQVIRQLQAEQWQEAGDYQLHMDVSDLPSGIYFVQWRAGEEWRSEKLVRQR